MPESFVPLTPAKLVPARAGSGGRAHEQRQVAESSMQAAPPGPGEEHPKGVRAPRVNP